MAKINRSRQDGAVSLFSVIFSALLLTILTVGFMKIMVTDQEQAMNNDLSQSAYDSAMAGVEDAKRAVRRCQAAGPSSAACRELNDATKNKDCQVVSRVLNGAPAPGETIVRSRTGASGGQRFNQAYTCVNISMDTDDYLYTAKEGVAEMIPLNAGGDVSRISIEWFMQADAGEGVPATVPCHSRPNPAGCDDRMPRKSAWGNATPPIVRAQLITPGDSFNLTDLDKKEASQTVFIRPKSIITTGSPASQIISVGNNPRAVDSDQFNNDQTSIACYSFAIRSYSCRAILNLTKPITASASKNAFLRLNTIYNGASVRVQMLSSSSRVVKFVGVQPTVDSNGRASNLFRRVEARLKVGSDFQYPSYAVDSNENLCKDFSVHSAGAAIGSCRP